MQYVQRQLRERRDHLIAEQAFQQEALLNPRLRELVRAHRQILQQGVTHFFEVLGSRQPEQDAVLLTATIMQMEYQGCWTVSKIWTVRQCWPFLNVT